MFQIRNATVKDCLGIAETQVDSYRTTYAGLFPTAYLEHITYAEQEQDWIRLLSSDTKDILSIAISEENQVIGYVLARAQPDIYPGFDSEIIALHVRQPFQRKGIGKALLDNAIKSLITFECGSVMLWTLRGNRIRQWYEKLGGQLIGERSYDVDDWVINEVAYGWKEIGTLRYR